MPIIIQPYREEHEQAVREFNQRLMANGGSDDLLFFTSAKPQWLPKTEGANLYQEFFLALDGEVMRGGYALKHQDFQFSDGTTRSIGYYHHPISEGVVDAKYATLGAMLLKDAMNRAPLLYCLGMGGYDRPLPKMLMRLGWSHFAVPFYFKVVRPNRFLREMQALRTSQLRKLALDFATFSGAGWAAIKAMQAFRRLGSTKPAAFQVDQVREFSDWTNALWEQARRHCTLTAVRNCQTLRTLYPPTETHLMRLRVRRAEQDIGWAVIGERRKDEKYGDLRVGSIVDCWAAPQEALAVVSAASSAAADLGMDLIVSNQSHQMWIRAFEQAGFVNSTSNFIFAAGKKLAALLDPFAENRTRFHFTRADGDGLPRNF
jgi:hypothetical protein